MDLKRRSNESKKLCIFLVTGQIKTERFSVNCCKVTTIKTIIIHRHQKLNKSYHINPGKQDFSNTYTHTHTR